MTKICSPSSLKGWPRLKLWVLLFFRSYCLVKSCQVSNTTPVCAALQTAYVATKTIQKQQLDKCGQSLKGCWKPKKQTRYSSWYNWYKHVNTMISPSLSTYFWLIHQHRLHRSCCFCCCLCRRSCWSRLWHWAAWATWAWDGQLPEGSDEANRRSAKRQQIIDV